MDRDQVASDSKVSIVIPVYNGSNYVREAIESALTQTYKNIEVIVVNDGSDDGGETAKIARSYEDKVRYFEKEHGGVASALNFGIQKMSGEYFSWLSHDDIYYPTKIEQQMRLYHGFTGENAVLYTDFDIIDESSNIIGNLRVEPRVANNPLFAILGTYIHGCSTLVPKAIINRVGFFNERLQTTQDYEYWFRTYKEGVQFIHLPEKLIQSRQHSEQGQLKLKKVNKTETYEFYCRALDEVYEEISKHADRILNVLASKSVDLPFTTLRQQGKNGEKISLAMIFIYKLKGVLNRCILKVRSAYRRTFKRIWIGQRT